MALKCARALESKGFWQGFMVQIGWYLAIPTIVQKLR